MDCFLSFNILDHICTTCFVFANYFRKSFQSLFANGQRYMNKILRSIFKIWNFLPLFQMLFLWLNKTPPQWNSPLSVQEGFGQTAIYTDSKKLFHDLWREWLNIQLMDLSRGTPLQDMDLEDIFQCIPKYKQYELLNKQLYFAEKTGIENIIQKSKRCLKFRTISWKMIK